MARIKRLKEALIENSRLCDLVRESMGAFAHVDLKLVAEDQRSKIGDSLDLDGASKDEHPNASGED